MIPDDLLDRGVSEFARIGNAELKEIHRRAAEGDAQAIHTLYLVGLVRDLKRDAIIQAQAAQKKAAGSKGGSSPRSATEERDHEIMEEYNNMRNHGLEREDARRIADSLGIPFGTVRRVIRKNREKI